MDRVARSPRPLAGDEVELPGPRWVTPRGLGWSLGRTGNVGFGEGREFWRL